MASTRRVELTALMRHPREDKSDRTANGLFPIRDHAFDRDFQLVEQFFDFFEEGGLVSLATTE